MLTGGHESGGILVVRRTPVSQSDSPVLIDNLASGRVLISFGFEGIRRHARREHGAQDCNRGGTDERD